jgi:hypothetical protein
MLIHINTTSYAFSYVYVMFISVDNPLNNTSILGIIAQLGNLWANTQEG